jgi:hypothetical protein
MPGKKIMDELEFGQISKNECVVFQEHETLVWFVGVWNSTASKLKKQKTKRTKITNGKMSIF